MIIVAGHLRVATTDRDQYLAAVADVAVLARRAPGCHDFVQAPDPVDPERIVIYERWDDDDSLLAFRNSDDEDTAGPRVPDVLDADVRKNRISSVESP